MIKIDSWVVLTDENLDSRICKVVSIGDISISAKPIHPYKFHNNLKSILANGVFISPFGGFRLATDSEIQAGHRL